MKGIPQDFTVAKSCFDLSSDQFSDLDHTRSTHAKSRDITKLK
jgi:hypothetical protein